MTEEVSSRTIGIFLKGSDEPIWVVDDTAVPLPGDHVEIEDADGKAHTYSVESRTWITAKQGESPFKRVRLVVKKVEAGSTYSLDGIF